MGISTPLCIKQALLNSRQETGKEFFTGAILPEVQMSVLYIQNLIHRLKLQKHWYIKS